jgi:beta-glucanase (GH16 family)
MAGGNETAEQAILTHRPDLPLEARVPALSDPSNQNGTIIAAVTTSGTLDTSRFHMVWDHNFATNHSFSPELTRDWGNIALTSTDATLSSHFNSGWEHSGMMQPPTGRAADNGYGLYSVTLQINSGEGPGGYVCLWPATDRWPGPELDLVEKASTSNTSGYSTIHWKGSGSSDQYEVHLFPTSIDVSQKHTYAMDWEGDHISLYIDKTLIYTTTNHVPKDAAHGGQNEAFGAGMQPWGTQNPDGDNVMHVYDMSYYSPIA